MQYILSEEEYRDLVQKKNLHIKMQKQTLQNLCIEICDNMPVKTWADEKSPWGCILTKNSEYCDKCPVEEICPYEDKEYSK